MKKKTAMLIAMTIFVLSTGIYMKNGILISLGILDVCLTMLVIGNDDDNTSSKPALRDEIADLERKNLSLDKLIYAYDTHQKL